MQPTYKRNNKINQSSNPKTTTHYPNHKAKTAATINPQSKQLNHHTNIHHQHTAYRARQPKTQENSSKTKTHNQ